MSLANEKHLYYNKIREEVNRQMDLSRDYKWDKYTVYLHDLNAYARILERSYAATFGIHERQKGCMYIIPMYFNKLSVHVKTRGQICTPHSHIGVEKVNLDILKRIYYKLFNTMEVSYAEQKQAHCVMEHNSKAHTRGF